MAEPISFDAYLGWTNIADPANIPEDARVISAEDLLRYEQFGMVASEKINEIITEVAGLDSDTTVAEALATPTSATRAAVNEMVEQGVAGFQAVIDAVPGSVQAQVPPLVTEALAADDTVAQAAAAAATAEIAGKDLVESTDARMPTVGQSDEYLQIWRDANWDQTWLGIQRSDGGPTDWGMEHIRRRMQYQILSAPGYLIAFTDANRDMTDLSIRESDGQFAQFVVDRLKPRILEGFTPPEPVVQRQYANTKWLDGSDTYPVFTDKTKAIGVGSSSQAGMDPKFAAYFAAKGVTYYSGGKGSELAQHGAARLGSIPMLVTVAGGQIPASGLVNVTSSNVPLSAYLKPYAATLAGVHGTLRYDTASAAFAFIRDTTGTAVTVPANTPVIPDAQSYRDASVFLWLGKNNLGVTGAEELVKDYTDRSYDWVAPLAKQVVVLGQFVNGGTGSNSLEVTQITNLNAYWKKKYGNLFIDIQAYIMSPQVWVDAGITPTQADLDAQAAGKKPPSISSDDGHFNDLGYTTVFNYLIQPRLTLLGWFA